MPLQQPTAEHFSHFDGQSANLIGNLQLDPDEEPRRVGATSRANSVRFDETANPGHWTHASRSSLDLIPRTGSGMGGHVMKRTQLLTQVGWEAKFSRPICTLDDIWTCE